MTKEHYQKQIDEIMDTYNFEGIVELIQLLKNNNYLCRSDSLYKNYQNETWLRKEARRILNAVSTDLPAAVTLQSDCLLKAENINGELSLSFELFHSNNFKD